MKAVFGKAIFLVLITIFSQSLFAQQELIEFEGIIFDSNQESIKNLLISKGAILKGKEGPPAKFSELLFDSIPLEKETAIWGRFIFFENKLRICHFTFWPSIEKIDTIMKVYNNIKSILVNKFGKPTRNVTTKIGGCDYGEGYEKIIGPMPNYEKVKSYWENVKHGIFPALVILDISRTTGRSTVDLTIAY